MARQPINIDDLPEFLDGEDANGREYHPSQGAKAPEVDAVPDELTEMMEALGSVKEFWVNIQRVDNGTKVFCGKKINILPDPHQIGEEFGAGEYFLNVSWPDVSGTGKRPPRWKRLHYILDASYNEIHRNWLAMKNPSALVGGPVGFDTDLERLAKLQSVFGSKKDDSGLALVLEMVKEQNRQTERRMDKIQEEMKEDRKATKEMLKDLVGSLRETFASNKPTEQKSLVAQIGEVREVAGLLGMGGAEPPGDDRPAWMQAIDVIGDKLVPLLSAFAEQRGLKRAYAEKQLDKAMNPQNPIVAALMQNRTEQEKFIAEVCSQATTPALKAGAVNLAKRLGLPLPAGFVAQ